jgi:Skp family chaperone for outer membrane proteins
MFSKFVGTVLVGAAMTVASARSASAQEGAERVAICNPSVVFQGMDERKAIEDRMKSEQEKIKIEFARRKAEVDEMRKQRDELKRGSAQHNEKNRQLMQKAVEFRAWVQIAEAEMMRAEMENTRSLYDKIAEACKEVAESRKIDLVLAERRPELPEDIDQLKPEQVRQILSQRDVLYVSKVADITEAVVLLVNKKYAVGAAGGQK